ncbi:hypothetical protein [Absidia glauca]|uniref:Uncharacterized protein n=1 Tax=Absidia glauca TaxID=4829 RepID=A0A168QR84_ABSGL|nr:hypothetical protein [Absidia glauca]
MSLEDSLQEIRSLYKVNQATTPDTYLANPWLLVIVSNDSVAMAALNKPVSFQPVYNLLSDDVNRLSGLSAEEKGPFKAKLVLKQRDAILKGLVAYGCPKAITALFFLNEATPEDIRAHLPQTPLRPEKITLERTESGKSTFSTNYRSKAGLTHEIMYKIFPDLGMVVEKFLYPTLISYTEVTSPQETSLVMVTALFAEQVLPILKEHQQGAKANELTDEQLGLVYATVRCLAKAFGLDQRAFIDDVQKKYY